MKTYFKTLALFLMLLVFNHSFAQVDLNLDFDTPYGSNKTAGKYATVNGARIYYEEYGKGKPLFLIHGNGADIKSMGHQIEYFKDKYHVIVADSRGHGKSELKTDSLTYVQIADDWAGLANELKLDSLNIIGWSDGGIVGLLLGIHHPEKVKKLVVMGANLRPDTTAVYPWAVNWVKEMRDEVKAKIKAGDTTRNWDVARQHLGLLSDQPSISLKDLSKIQAPVLVVAGDKDVIREEHSVQIYQNIPHSQLAILPGETHFVPATDPQKFNKLAEEFISQPFKRPDTNWIEE